MSSNPETFDGSKAENRPKTERAKNGKSNNVRAAARVDKEEDEDVEDVEDAEDGDKVTVQGAVVPGEPVKLSRKQGRKQRRKKAKRDAVEEKRKENKEKLEQLRRKNR